MNLIPLTVSLTLAATLGISYLQSSQDEPQIINYRAGLLEFQDQAKQMGNIKEQGSTLKDLDYDNAVNNICETFNTDVFTQLFPKDIKGSVNFSGNYCEIVKLSIQAKADQDQDNIAIFSNLLQAAQASAISANSIVKNRHIHWFVHRDHKKTYQSNLKNRLLNCVTCTLGKERSDKIVNGGWSDWSKCDLFDRQTRTCDNPVLENDGLNCQPLGLNTRACTMYDNHHTITKALAEDHKPFNINDVFGREIDKTKPVKITIAADAVLIAPSTSVCALYTGEDYTGGLTIINNGKVYGHGGDGGDGGIADKKAAAVAPNKLVGKDGKDGGPAICVQTNITLDDQGIIAGGGGGGGGGTAAFDKEGQTNFAAGGGGGGGGYPNGKGGTGGSSTTALTKSVPKLNDDPKGKIIENDYPYGRDGKNATGSNPGSGGSNGINQGDNKPNDNDGQYFDCNSTSSCALGGRGGQGGEAGKKGTEAKEGRSQRLKGKGRYSSGKGGSKGCDYLDYKDNKDNKDNKPHTVTK